MFDKRECIEKIIECCDLIKSECQKEFVDVRLIGGYQKTININTNRIGYEQTNMKHLTKKVVNL